MLTKICIDCNQDFEVEESKAWATRCYPCWQQNNERQGKRKIEQLEQQVAYWKAKVNGDGDPDFLLKLREETESLYKRIREQQFRIVTLERLLESEREQRFDPVYRANGTDIPPEMLRRLLQLIHPDKHARSAAATEVTQWLLKLRKGK